LVLNEREDIIKEIIKMNINIIHSMDITGNSAYSYASKCNFKNIVNIFGFLIFFIKKDDFINTDNKFKGNILLFEFFDLIFIYK
jgi:hypothetical protein